jgi:hypothetical protein
MLFNISLHPQVPNPRRNDGPAFGEPNQLMPLFLKFEFILLVDIAIVFIRAGEYGFPIRAHVESVSVNRVGTFVNAGNHIRRLRTAVLVQYDFKFN